MGAFQRHSQLLNGGAHGEAVGPDIDRAPGLGREPILLIPGKMLEFSLIHFEMRQDLLADGSPLR